MNRTLVRQSRPNFPVVEVSVNCLRREASARMKESLNNEEGRSDRADLEDLICSAIAGDLESIESLVRSLQDEIYRLALRMTGNREDAEDSTQEILIRIVTRLAQFEFRSSLRTWVFRIAVNYILDLKRSRIE